MLKKFILSCWLALVSIPLYAADFYVVVPLQSKGAAEPAVVLALSAVPLPGGMVAEVYPGFDFNTALSVTGDPNFASAGVTWSVYSGELPAGLVLNADGTLSGTPTSAQSSVFHVRAAYKNKQGEQAYEIVVGAITVDLKVATPPSGVVGQVYSYDLRPLLTLSGKAGLDLAQAVWSVSGGSLPAGLALSGQGVITGTPTAETAPRQVTVRAMYHTSTGEQTYSFNVDIVVVIALGNATLPGGMVAETYAGFDFNTALSVTGDPGYETSGVTWSVSSGALPAGLVLNANGKVSGEPTAAQTASFQVRAVYRDKHGEQAYQIIVGKITVTLASATPPTGEVGKAYSYNLHPLLSLSGKAGLDPALAVWSVAGGTLPAGLALSSQGVIAGTPTAETAPRQVTVRAMYQSGVGEQAYQFQVKAAAPVTWTATMKVTEVHPTCAGGQPIPRFVYHIQYSWSNGSVTTSATKFSCGGVPAPPTYPNYIS